jgi:phosphoglycerol transferase MdoB-like AlkP superfamily enzyme
MPQSSAHSINVQQTDAISRRFGCTTPYLLIARSILATLVIAAALTFFVELIARGSLADTMKFLSEPFRPAFATILLFAIVLLGLDALLGRAHMGIMLLAPVVLALAATGQQKSYYLGDPLYPADFLYGRQILELLPLLAKERVGTAVLIVAIIALLAILIPFAWMRWRRRMRVLQLSGRVVRAAVAAP